MNLLWKVGIAALMVVAAFLLGRRDERNANAAVQLNEERQIAQHAAALLLQYNAASDDLEKAKHERQTALLGRAKALAALDRVRYSGECIDPAGLSIINKALGATAHPGKPGAAVP